MHQIAGASGEITVTEAAYPLSSMACSRKQPQRKPRAFDRCASPGAVFPLTE